MSSVCFYFQVHQPWRLRRYSVFDRDDRYFDEQRNGDICRKVAQRCYLPANRLMLELINRYQGRFRVAYSLTGLVVEQLERYAPEVIDSFRRLADTGAVELLAETYHHSLSFLYSREEFSEQVRLHQDMVERVFGQRPRVFRNTELIANNDLAFFIGGMGFDGLLCEGADHALAGRSPCLLYRTPGAERLTLLLKNYRLSDDIAFRFSNQAWPEWPLTADKYARWLSEAQGDTINLFMDYETLGEHQWAETGVFDFLAHLPEAVFARGDLEFRTPSEVIATHPAVEVYDVPHMTSWADTERDLSAWLGNAMQSNALHELYRLEREIKARDDARILDDWRRLQASDHFYYMCVKYYADADVHKYFNPYESPYDSYINFMNVLDSLRRRLHGPSSGTGRGRLATPAGTGAG